MQLPHVSPHIPFLSSVRTARWSTRRDPSLTQLCIPSGISNQYLKAGAWRPPFRHRGIDALARWQVGWAGGNSANLTICSPGLTDALLSHRDFFKVRWEGVLRLGGGGVGTSFPPFGMLLADFLTCDASLCQTSASFLHNCLAVSALLWKCLVLKQRHSVTKLPSSSWSNPVSDNAGGRIQHAKSISLAPPPRCH